MQNEEIIVVGGDEVPTHLLCVLVPLRTPTWHESGELHCVVCKRQAVGEHLHNILTSALAVDSFTREHKDQGDNMDLTKLLIEAKADANQPDAEGSTPLIFAIRSNFLQGVQVLLQMRADPHLRHSTQNASPLYYAANMVSEESICLLLRHRTGPSEFGMPSSVLQDADDYRSRIQSFVEAVQETNAAYENK
eukprot:s1136_g10.t1